MPSSISSSRSCSSPESVRLHEREHLHLVELVHPEHALGVLARGPRLAPEAGGEAGVAERQLARGEDLVRVQRRERHLGRPGEVQLVLRHPVQLLLGVGEHPGAEQGALAHQDGRHHRREPALLEDATAPTAPGPAPAARAAPSGTRSAIRTRARPARGRGRRPRARRGSGPSSPASPTSRITSSSSGALGSSRFGRPASTSARRSSSVRSSSSSPFSRSDTPRTSAIASEASSPLRCSSPICLLAWFLRARSSSSSGSRVRRRSSSSSASSSTPGSIPRRVSETRAGSGSSRICLRSSIATPPPASCSCPSTCRGSRPPRPPGGRSRRWRA